MLELRSVCPALAAALLGLAAAAPRAENPPPPAAPARASSTSLAALFKARRPASAVNRIGDAAAAADVTEPALTTFDAGTTFNVNKATPLFSILIKGTDDLSGIRDAGYFATGPSGQRIFGSVLSDYPATAFNRRGSFTSLYSARLLQPGTWTIDKAGVEDVAGNNRGYDQAELAALGNTSFTVVNSGGYDAVAPTLTSGQILTPAVSVSASAKGAPNQAAFVGVKLTAADTGSTAVAGLAGAHAAFCLADESRCLDLFTSTPNGGSQPTGSFTLGMQVSPVLGMVPGDYLLYGVAIWDQAGNFQFLLSTTFGGPTDFSALFPTTKITLKP